MNISDQIMNRPEIAHLLGCTEQTVWNRVNAGKFPTPERISNRPLWRRETVMEFIAKNLKK
jgi:predicted DNA-binding transcriptional regulator AlpA